MNGIEILAWGIGISAGLIILIAIGTAIYYFVDGSYRLFIERESIGAIEIVVGALITFVLCLIGIVIFLVGAI
jgi:hypothetical protein